MVRSLFEYDAAGILRWMRPTNRRIRRGAIAGSMRDDGYLEVQVNGARVRVHRLVWFFVRGEWPTNSIDHINGNRSDNRIENLRDVSRQVNSQNQRSARRGSLSGLLGVSWNAKDKRWHAKITVGGRCMYIGQYLDASEAHEAYLSAKRELHEGCTL